MKERENRNNDKLRSLFQKIELEQPSSSFESKLMQRIQQEALKREQKANHWYNITFLLCCAAFIGTAIFVYFYYNITWTSISDVFQNTFQTIYSIVTKNAKMTSIFITIFILLVIDIIIRTRMYRKERNGK